MRAERVTAERERLGMKQAELAREIGVSKQMINGSCKAVTSQANYFVGL